MIGYACPACARRFPVELDRWRCDCGAPLDLAFEPKGVSPAELARRPRSLARYREVLPLPEGVEPVDLGAGLVPVVEEAIGDIPVRLVLEYVSPTGSFKDRGAALVAALAAFLGAGEIVEDSSGNAGIALAAHSARAGLRARIYAPEDAAPAKLRLASEFGAEIVLVKGGREAAARAAASHATTRRAFYASHAWSPFFLHGTKSFAYGLAETVGWSLPGAVILPAGYGTLALGAHLGFAELVRLGLARRHPALVLVQPLRCAPLWRAFERGEAIAAPVPEAPTAADGARVPRPIRSAQLLSAVRETGGLVAAIEEEEIASALRALWRKGYAVEPTAALGAALVRREGASLRARYGSLAVVLTGSGLKG